eukprot:6189500-Pleurochrysis_carterae.AAC.2
MLVKQVTKGRPGALVGQNGRQNSLVCQARNGIAMPFVSRQSSWCRLNAHARGSNLLLGELKALVRALHSRLPNPRERLLGCPLRRTPCAGGVDAGHDGDGYCVVGNTGSKCEVRKEERNCLKRPA